MEMVKTKKGGMNLRINMKQNIKYNSDITIPVVPGYNITSIFYLIVSHITQYSP
jgi:hypothetical protein